MHRSITVTACALALAGVATAQEEKNRDLQHMEVLWDNGPVNYEGTRIRNDELIHPADLIWDNGDDNYSNGYEMTQWIEANDFTLVNVAVVGHIDFSVLDTSLGGLDNWDGTGEWFIYGATGGGIGSLIDSGNLTNFETVFDRTQTWDFWDFSADLDNPARLDPGTYYIGLHLNQNNCQTRDELYWGDTNPNGSLPRYLDQFCDGSFSQGGSESAFTLSGRAACIEMQVSRLVGGERSIWRISEATPGATGVVAYGFATGETVFNGEFGYCATFGIDGIDAHRIVGRWVAGPNGVAIVRRVIPADQVGRTIFTQASQEGTCPNECMSEVNEQVVR